VALTRFGVVLHLLPITGQAQCFGPAAFADTKHAKPLYAPATTTPLHTLSRAINMATSHQENTALLTEHFRYTPLVRITLQPAHNALTSTDSPRRHNQHSQRARLPRHQRDRIRLLQLLARIARFPRISHSLVPLRRSPPTSPPRAKTDRNRHGHHSAGIPPQQHRRQRL
jgi:hypothetical protein